MRNKISKSHIEVYEYFVRLVSNAKSNEVETKYMDISKATGYTYPIIAKCIPDLIGLKCLKIVEAKRGRNSTGTTYLVDTGFNIIKQRVAVEKTYRVEPKKKKYTIKANWTREEIRFEK